MTDNRSGKILLLGGNGFIGRSLLKRLQSLGSPVRVVSRAAIPEPHLYESFIGDLTDPDFNFERSLDGISIVINCAGEIRDESRMEALHVHATLRYLRAAQQMVERSGPIHWVQLSSVGAYGPGFDKPRVVTESTPLNPQGVYEDTKTQADDLVTQYCASPGMSYSILRPSNVYGPGMPNGSLRSLASMIRKNLYVHIGPASAVATYVHVEDVVDALVLCAFDRKATNMVFNISNDCLFSELVEMIASSTGARQPRLRIPVWFARIIIGLLSKITALPLTQSRIDALVTQTRYSTEHLYEVVGYQPQRRIIERIDEIL